VRWTLLLTVLALVGACSDATKQKADVVPQPENPGVVYIAGEPSWPIPIKVPPYVHDPALEAKDQRSCAVAGGEWGDTYVLGVLFSREPFDAKYYGDHPENARATSFKQCWSNRKPVTYSDAGKPCESQSDCEMNCIAKRIGGGRFDTPKCQATELDQPNCEYVYDGGKYHPTECAIP
jgi:hypothetical protein